MRGLPALYWSLQQAPIVVQVPCPAEGNLMASIVQYRPQSSGGSYIVLTLLNAKVTGSFRAIDLRSSGAAPQVMPHNKTLKLFSFS